ncbi:MAG: response regulator [Myxococcales bacterium]|jgi:CheY-like chemotaxis protein/Tfp pilus assembly protein PilF|nr:response regulator [Myxococcales bacterium]
MSLTLLIADDDPALFSRARTALSRGDCAIEAAFSGVDCLARARAGGIDAVLLDLAMPNTDSFSVLDELTRLPMPPTVLLMLDEATLTEPRLDQPLAQALAKGLAIAALPKPIDFDLALQLLTLARRANAESVHLSLPTLARPALVALASQALARGTLFLEEERAPQLPPATPLTIAIEMASGPLCLSGMADPTIRQPGKRGLGVRLSELNGDTQELLRALTTASPEPKSSPPRAASTRMTVPSKADERFRRALEKLEQGKYDSALIDLRQALEFDPGNPAIGAACQRAETRAGMSKAATLFQRALEESEPAQALKLIEDAIRLDDSRAAYHREAARLTLRAGGPIDKAEAHIEQAILLAPSDPAPRHILVQMLERAGRFTEALWACGVALLLFPSDKELTKIAARLQRKAGGGTAE